VLIRHPDYTRRRLARTAEQLHAAVYPESVPVDDLAVSGETGRISWHDAQSLDVRPAELGERFGPLWATYWFRGQGTVPEAWRGSRVDLLWDSGSEATLWLEGRATQGLNQHHGDAVLVGRAAGGEAVSFQVELACNGLFGRQAGPVELRRCELARFDPAAWQLFHDFETLRLLAIDPGLDEAWAGELLSELNRFCNEHDPAILTSLYEHHNGTRAHEIAGTCHFEHPQRGFVAFFGNTVNKDCNVGIRPMHFLDGAGDRNDGRMIEHRRRMMSGGRISDRRQT